MTTIVRTASTAIEFVPACEDEKLIEKHAREADRLRRMAVAYSDAHKIKALPREEVYGKSLRIPPEGIREKLSLSFPPLNYEDGWNWAFPVIRGGTLTAKAAERLGTFSVLGNVVKFVDRNGDTWMSPCLSVLEVLQEKGFTRVVDLDVHFVGGDRPTGIFNGKDAKCFWERLLVISRKEHKDLPQVASVET